MRERKKFYFVKTWRIYFCLYTFSLELICFFAVIAIEAGVDMIPKANFLQLPTIIVGLLLLSLNFVAVAKEPEAAVEEAEVHSPTLHGLINIDDNQENLQDYMASSSDGSGEDVITDDEDQGSGNGDVYPSSGTSVQPELSAVTDDPNLRTKLTPCLRQHKEHKASGNIYVPHCTKKGEYHKRQCTNYACWCVDPNGLIIKGTNRSESDEKPDCENGSNLGLCLKSLLKHSTGLLGSFRPKCSESGDYKAIQCHESKCWCVDKQGTEVESTKVNLPQIPICVETNPIPSTVPSTSSTTTTTTATTTKDTTTTTTEATTSSTTSTTTIKLTSTKRNEFHLKNPGYDINDVSVSSVNEVTNSGNLAGSDQSKSDNATPVTREPGIMAAIIAGAVVGLFVSILLAMFVVYRMRKKDEGSYPLDEPCKNNYTYTKAPDKEFYA